MAENESANNHGRESKMMTAAKKAKTWFKRSARGWKATTFIIGAVVVKGFANYAIVWSLMDYISDIREKNIGFAAATINLKEGLESLVTIAAIFLSDAYVGRYYLLLVFMALYIYGLLFFSLSVPGKMPLFYIALMLLAAGEGGMEGTLREFIADQFAGIENKKSSVRPSQICWYAGSFAGSALGMIANGIIFRGLDNDEKAWKVGGFISTALMGAGFYWIAAGTLLYKMESLLHNLFEQMLRVLVTAIPKRQADHHGVDEESRMWGRWHPEEEGCRRNSGESQRKEGLKAESNACNEMDPKLHEIQIRNGNGMPELEPEEEGCRSSGESQRKAGLGAESNACSEVDPRLHEIQTRNGNGMPDHEPEEKGCRISVESQRKKEGLRAESNACNEVDPKLHEIQIRNGNGMPNQEVVVQLLTSGNKNSITISAIANNDTNTLPRTADDLSCEELGRASVTEITSDPGAEAGQESVLALRNQTEVESARPFLSVIRLWIILGLFPIWTAIGLFPIWTTFLMYGMVLSMGETFFLEQASSMDLRIGHSHEFPLTFLIAVSALSRIFISRACLPLLSWATGQKHGIPPTLRIGAGQILVTLCCFAASLVEAKRMKAIENRQFLPGYTNLDEATVAMSVLWLVPQYVLSGAMNGLLRNGISDFFVDQVPKPLRACQDIFSESILSMGRLLSALAIVATSKLSKVGGRPSWFASTINSCRLHDYYKTLVFLSLVNLCFYLYFAKRYPWNMTTSEEGTETADEMLLNELSQEAMKAQQQDQRRRQDDDKEDELLAASN